MDGTKLYVNWGGEPMQVTPVGGAGDLSAAEQDEFEKYHHFFIDIISYISLGSKTLGFGIWKNFEQQW